LASGRSSPPGSQGRTSGGDEAAALQRVRQHSDLSAVGTHAIRRCLWLLGRL
jgi:hypothetical protein